MLKLSKFAIAGLITVSVAFPAVAADSTKAAAPAAAAAAPAAAAPAAATGTPATGLVCAVVAKGKYVHIQAVNKGTATVPAGDTFAFTIVGHKKSTKENVTLKADLAAGASVNVTNAIKASSVVSCTPAT